MIFSSTQRKAKDGRTTSDPGDPLKMEVMPVSKQMFEPVELLGRNINVCPVRIAASDAVLARFEQFLRPSELIQAKRFRFDHLRRSYVLSRGSLRLLLGRYLGMAPNHVPLSRAPRGKPILDEGRIKFSVSHSGDMVLFGFTRGCEIGIDVEQIRPLQDVVAIAHRFFCHDEAAELMSLPPDERLHAFFLCWTRKEAYIKALGEGLYMPLDGFRVTVAPLTPARLIHINSDTSAAEAWMIHNIESTPEYAGALAYRDAMRPVCVLPQVTPAELLEML
jgi:4'-phosphopantetheinyl transferase